MSTPKEIYSGYGVPKNLEPRKRITEDTAYEPWPDGRVIIGNRQLVEDIISGKHKFPEPPKDEWSHLPEIPGRERKPTQGS